MSMEQEHSSPIPLSPTPSPTGSLTPTASLHDGAAANIFYTFSNETPFYNSDDEEVTSTTIRPPPKRSKLTHQTQTQTLDRLSLLPDSLLLHILSLLPIRNAVASSSLSKRWRHTWTSLPTLIFNHRGSWDEGIAEFVEFVNATILLYSNTSLIKFSLNFEFSRSFASKVTTWLRFATQRNAEEIDLHFFGDQDMYPSDGEHYTLPQFMFDYSLVKSLRLHFCDIMPLREVSWKMLRNLYIGYAALSNELVEKILSRCPVLECLELYKCGGVSRLDIRSVSLKKLVVSDYWDFPDYGESDGGLEIMGSHLRSLSIVGFFYRRKLKVRDVGSLVDVRLDFQLLTFNFEGEYDDNNYEEYRGMVAEILESVCHVEEVTIGHWCLQVLAICELTATPSLLSKHKRMNLDTQLQYWDLPGIALLLRSSPDLETLVINMAFHFDPEVGFSSYFTRSQPFQINDWASQEMRFDHLLLNLRTVKIVGFIADASDNKNNHIISLMQFFLKNAMVLMKMVIHPQNYDRNRWWMRGRTKDLLSAGRSLLSFPRSSPYAEVILLPVKDSN